jgi:endonuclease/exonuclease/phosphatase family metal-dependent hydrolase
MHHLKIWLLIVLCVSVTFVQSEKLPKKLQSNFQVWEQNESYLNKIEGGEVNVLSYNTWGLPIALFGHDQAKRFSKMSDSIINIHADIIGLQETFHPDLRDKLLSHLTKDYYTFNDYRCGRTIIPGVEMDCTGGLMTFSVFPIIDEQFFPFPTNEKYSLIEKTGRKGFLVSYLRHGQKTITVVNTHLYAGHDEQAENIRMQQVQYILKVMNSQLIKSSDQTIMLGDFNIHHPDVACSDVYDFIIQKMHFLDSKPHIDASDYTFTDANAYCPNTKQGSKLDYVFTKPTVGGKILSQSRVLDSNQPLSDHYGWQVKYIFEPAVTAP